MSEIVHRISIDAPPERVHDLVATTDGVARWWTGREATGSSGVGERFSVYFSDADKPAAIMEVTDDGPDEVAWQVIEGPSDWIGTRISFALLRRAGGGTTLLFRHSGWAEASEFLGGCTSNWGAYLGSLASGAERGEFAAFPAGEVSRWD